MLAKAENMTQPRLQQMLNHVLPASSSSKLMQDAVVKSRQVIPLDTDWVFRQADGDSFAQTFRTTTTPPAHIHLDLLAHNLIPDPFVELNERDVQWVGEKTWIYRTIFQVSNALVKGSAYVDIVFDGLDTFATVKIDGKEILQTDNMFQSYRVSVRELLARQECHVVEIIFEDAISRGQKRISSNSEHAWGVWNGDPSRTAVRKAQYHYGWDWGPKLMTCGPWKPIYLEIYNSRIVDLHFHTSLSADLSMVEIVTTIEIEGIADRLKLELLMDARIIKETTLKACKSLANVAFKVVDPRIWWPFTHGDQPLYELRATLFDAAGELSDVKSKTFGVRKVELVQRPLLDQDGTTFFFRINNVPLFITGACWIPADSFTSRVAPQKYYDWVALARKGNQAMLRVWGGGIFEHEAFYNACDKLGVLVWQDFLFACGNYPTYPEMLQSVQIEAEQNVRLLRHHPSIVIWAGNNEDYLYQALAGLDYDPENHDPESWLKTKFSARYIYEHLLRKICEELTPGTPYHPGSPFGGAVATDPTIGDIHQWSVWHLNQAPYQEYSELSGRFISEFGMQGLPVKRTVDEYFLKGTTDEQKTTESEVIVWHNKASGATDTLKRYLDSNLPDYATTLDSYIYATQLIQSEALATAYRSWKRDWKGPGREYCGGLLVWQLNDCWPVTSWSVADYHLRPKMSYYAIKRESELITIASKRASGRLEGWVVNLTLKREIADIRLRAWSISTSAQLFDRIMLKDLVLEPNYSTDFSLPTIPEFDPKNSHDVVIVVYLELYNSTFGTLIRHVNFHEPLKEVSFQQPSYLKLNICADAGKGSTWLEVSAETAVKGLFIEVEDTDADRVVWDDNGVDLVPGEVWKLKVEGLKVGDEEKLRARWLGGSLRC